MRESFTKNPIRCQILKSEGSYFKAGQYAYIVGADDTGGKFVVDRKGQSRTGELTYLVSKTKSMAGGALWFAATSIRITGRPKKVKG